MDWLNLYRRRIGLWFKFVGREWYSRIGPILAWQLACTIHPDEDLNKWWLKTGWMGPGSGLYCREIGGLVGVYQPKPAHEAEGEGE